MDRVKDNKVLLRELKEDVAKLKQDTSIIKIDLKVIIAKLELDKPKPEPINKGWFG